jgi:hypothetical protein
LDDLNKSTSFCIDKVKVLEEASNSQVNSLHALISAEGLTRQEALNSQVNSLHALISAEGLTRQEALEKITQRIHEAAEINMGEKAELHERVGKNQDSCMAACSFLSGEVSRKISSNFDAFEKVMADERSRRQKSESDLEQRLVESIESMVTDMRKTVGDMVSEICGKERDQAKALLSHAQQMLESDTVLRDRLHRVLQREMVSKDEFLEEVGRLWKNMTTETGTTPVRILSVPRTASLGSTSLAPGVERQRSGTQAESRPLSVPRTASLGSTNLTPGPERQRSGTQAESRGSSPLNPNRVRAASLAAYASRAPVIAQQSPRSVVGSNGCGVPLTAISTASNAAGPEGPGNLSSLK